MGLYIDVHCHLHDPAFDADVDQVVERARKAGVVRIVTNGISSETNRHCVEIAKRHDIVEAALGWYPFDALTKEEAATQKKTIDEEIEFIRDSKPIAIGEVGLDYKWGKDKKQQKEHFQKMIDLAKELDIPLIVHSRKAEEDAIEILESNSLKKVVMHCFNGNFRLVKRSAGNGWVFSIPTCINKNEHFQKLVRE
ncbi:MAG: TatD family hydrolase, partial [Candidatus Nanoarchaeia archaeon]